MNCEKCAYRERIPGDCHSKCVHNFAKSGKKIKIRLTQWSRYFPLNFDPRLVESCEAFSKERDPELVWKYDPLIELIGLLAR